MPVCSAPFLLVVRRKYVLLERSDSKILAWQFWGLKSTLSVVMFKLLTAGGKDEDARWGINIFSETTKSLTCS